MSLERNIAGLLLDSMYRPVTVPQAGPWQCHRQAEQFWRDIKHWIAETWSRLFAGLTASIACNSNIFMLTSIFYKRLWAIEPWKEHSRAAAWQHVHWAKQSGHWLSHSRRWHEIQLAAGHVRRLWSKFGRDVQNCHYNGPSSPQYQQLAWRCSAWRQ